MKKKRMANMELLRILAMMMVVMLHYLSKGHVLPDLTGLLNLNGYLAWMLETLSIVAVNIYMLIAGYFLTESRFRTSRLLQLLCQILFYSILIPVVLIAAGILKPGGLTIYQLLQYFLPVQMEHYWFATAYVILYLLTPVLRTAVCSMNKSQLKATIVLLLLFFSVSKSVLPVSLTVDQKGYDAIWFVCVFLCAAYIRQYGIPWFDSSRKCVLCYLGCCCGILGITLTNRLIYLVTGRLEDFIAVAYHYNHILNLGAAISLFYAFYYCRIKEGKLADLICRISPYTFGVYLLHEQIEIRNLWPAWLGATASGNPLLFLIRCMASVPVVFAVGILVDMVRGAVFGQIGRFFKGGRLDRFLLQIDTAINMDSRSMDSQSGKTAAERK